LTTLCESPGEVSDVGAGVSAMSVDAEEGAGDVAVGEGLTTAGTGLAV
jgi:hypothetical protein